MPGLKFSVTLDGWKELRAKLTPPEDLYAAPWRKAVEEMADVGYTAEQAAAPIRSGQTQLKLQKKVQQRKVPYWAVVKTTATRNKYPYPRLTNFSPYAQSRYRTGVNPHRHWFTNALKRVETALNGILDRAGNEIETLWATR